MLPSATSPSPEDRRGDSDEPTTLKATLEFFRSPIMAKNCVYCGKGTTFGRNISHAHNVTSRRFEANLQRVRAVVEGKVRRIWACTRCIRSGKVVKPVVRKWEPETAES